MVYSVNFKINEVTKLAGALSRTLNNRLLASSVNALYYYEWGRVWQTDEAAEGRGFGYEPGNVSLLIKMRWQKKKMDDRVIVGSEVLILYGIQTN